MEGQQHIKKDSRYERWRWVVFAVTYLAYAGFYLTRKSFPVAKVGILNDPSIDLSKGAMGLIDGLYGAAYALGNFVWGMCGDKFGPRKVVLTGLFFSILAAVAMGLSSTAILMGVLFFIQGLCQSTGWAPLTKNVSYWFSRKERGRIYGFWATNYAIGGTVAGFFAGYMAQKFSSWRFAFFGPAAILAGIWVLFLILQKNRPEDIGLPSIEEYHGEPQDILDSHEKQQDEPEGSWKAIIKVFKNPMIIRMSVVYFLLKPVRYAILFWGPVMIYEKLGTNIAQSAGISVIFEIAGPLGVIFAGYASDKWFQSRRMPVIVISFFLLSVVLFLFNSLGSSGSKLMMGELLFAIGFLLYGPDTLISGACAVDFGTKKGASSAAGLINGLGSTGQILGMLLPGIISEHYGWGVLFSCFGVFVLIAALLLLPKWNAVPATAKNSKS